MGLPGRAEIRIDAQVEPKRAAPEPRTASNSEIRELRFLGQLKDARIERARRRFLTGWHGELNVMQSDNLTHGRAFPCRRHDRT